MNTYDQIEKKRSIACDTVFFLCIVLSIVIAFCVVSKKSSVPTVSVNTPSIDYQDSALLSSIEPPVFEEVLCDLFLAEEGVGHPVVWGACDNQDFVMWYESGYPGFGMPIVISGIGFVCKSDCVVLKTQYGIFKYKFCKTGIAFDNDHHLIEYNSKKEITNYTEDKESLILYNEQSELYWVYELTQATAIV